MEHSKIIRPNFGHAATKDGIATQADARIVQMAAQVGAAEARRIVDEKEAFLKARIEERVEEGYRVEEFMLVEQEHFSGNPKLAKLLIAPAPGTELIHPFALACRRWYRRNICTYVYSIEAVRGHSKIQDGQA